MAEYSARVKCTESSRFVSVGAKTFKTKVIENTIAPTWNAYYEVSVKKRDSFSVLVSGTAQWSQVRVVLVVVIVEHPHSTSQPRQEVSLLSPLHHQCDGLKSVLNSPATCARPLR